MGKELAVRAWAYGEDVVLESYRYAPGPAGGGEKHPHEGYQFYLSLDFSGEYRYRGERHSVPVGSLSVIHSGEVQSSREPHDRKTTANFRVMYFSSGMLSNAASEVAGRNFGLPFSREPTLAG